MKQPDWNQTKLLRSGDIAAFDAFYWEYHKVVYTNIRRLIKDAETAKDILQEVFVSLWLNRETINDSVNIAGWLFTTSYRKSIDHLRARLVHQPAILPIDPIDNDTEEEDLRLEVIQKAVDQLSPQKRKVFELCKLKGKTYEETALELNISRHTVKEYLSSAIHQIREQIHQLPKSSVSVLFFLFSYPPDL